MKLKLADYGRNLPDYDEEKEAFETFERFLELGKDFVFGGEFIQLPNQVPESNYYENGESEELYGRLFKRDEKDPLNRFDGLFNGRTYGNGRFILIAAIVTQEDCLHLKKDTAFFGNYYRKENLAFQDEVIKIGYCDYDDNEYVENILLIKNGWDSQKLTAYNYDSYGEPRFELLGDLHQNPELWEKWQLSPLAQKRIAKLELGR